MALLINLNSKIVNPAPLHILAARAAGLSPYMNGAIDAAAKRPCNADDWSPWDGDRAEYVEGYRAQQRDDEAYQAGWRDYEAGYYWPLAPDNPKYGDYIRGQNDAWAKENKRTIWR